MRKIYLAASLRRSVVVEVLAASLRPTHDVVSGWHARHNGSHRDPIDEDERASLCASNLAELISADVVVVLVDDGEPKATYGELGFALALCKPCVFVHDAGTGRCILDAHCRVVRLDMRAHTFADIPLAIETAAGLIETSVHDRDTMPDLTIAEVAANG